jgi:hypothetical protein
LLSSPLSLSLWFVVCVCVERESSRRCQSPRCAAPIPPRRHQKFPDPSSGQCCCSSPAGRDGQRRRRVAPPAVAPASRGLRPPWYASFLPSYSTFVFRYRCAGIGSADSAFRRKSQLPSPQTIQYASIFLSRAWLLSEIEVRCGSFHRTCVLGSDVFFLFRQCSGMRNSVVHSGSGGDL